MSAAAECRVKPSLSLIRLHVFLPSVNRILSITVPGPRFTSQWPLISRHLTVSAVPADTRFRLGLLWCMSVAFPINTDRVFCLSATSFLVKKTKNKNLTWHFFVSSMLHTNMMKYNSNNMSSKSETPSLYHLLSTLNQMICQSVIKSDLYPKSTKWANSLISLSWPNTYQITPQWYDAVQFISSCFKDTRVEWSILIHLWLLIPSNRSRRWC